VFEEVRVRRNGGAFARGACRVSGEQEKQEGSGSENSAACEDKRETYGDSVYINEQEQLYSERLNRR
jgi:hypothetical protein